MRHTQCAMQKQKELKPLEAKILFRTIYGEFSDSLWYRTRKVFNNDFPMTEDNIRWVATLKKMLPRFNIENLDIMQSIKTINSYLSSHQKTTGEELLNLFTTHEIKIHKNTITNWFRPLGGFSQRRTYTLTELTPIILAAFTWKLKQQIKEVTNHDH